MSLKSTVVEFILQLKKNKNPLFFLIFYWAVGIIYYSFVETNKTILNIIFVASSIRSPGVSTDFSGFYQLIWPILLEVIVFGFLIAVLLERYNPVITSKIIAKHQNHHTIVLGYHHIGERIVEYLQEHNKPYVLIEIEEEKVLDLIDDGEPVVVGDFLEESVLLDAGVKNCKEIFFLTNDFRKAMICADKVRKLNTHCSLYMRVFEKEFQTYLKEKPWEAYTFSSSKWTMLSIHKWTREKTGPAIVLGHDHIAQLIADYLANAQGRKVFMIDPEIGLEYFHEANTTITFITEQVKSLNKLDDYCDITEISQVFICWKSEKHLQESILLTIDLHHNHPQIETYARVFDEEVMPIFERYNAITFSTSYHAFKMLQNDVNIGSNIYDKHAKVIDSPKKFYDFQKHKITSKEKYEI